MLSIGIDLGTTHSLIAVYKDGKPELIPNVHGDFLTPSVVSLDEDGHILVGKAARERQLSHPNKTVHAFKRMMGTDRTWKLGKQSFRAEELSALIIKSLKADAETHLDAPVTEAVISVPAYFNDTQRNATRQAAELAGLTVTQLINEPTAGALVYGLNDQEDDRRYLILDLGGGTFDVTILEYFDGVFEVHASAGDNHLGGEDFTRRLADWLIEQAKEQSITLDELRAYGLAEQAKRQLRSQPEQQLELGEGKTITVSEALFAELVEPLMERVRQPVIQAIRDASLTPNDFDDVVLIGGSTRLSVFYQFATRLFQRFPRQTENPDHVVALGAAVLAGMISRHETLSEVVMTDVMPYSMGIGISNAANPGVEVFDPIIERNQTVPISREETYVPNNEKQKSVTLNIYQGESHYVQNNLKIGTIEVPMPKAAEERYASVRFTYDVNALLEVNVVTGHGNEHRLVIEQSPGKMTQSDIEAALAKLSSIKIHPRDTEKNRALLARAERLYEQSLGDERSQLQQFISEFEALLLTQDTRLIESRFEAFQEALRAFEEQEWR
jgi:molecular chaperone HscC